MSDPTLVSRLLRIADQLTSALDVSRERLHQVSQQSKKLEESALSASDDAGQTSSDDVDSIEEGRDIESVQALPTDEEGYVRPQSPPLDGIPITAFLGKVMMD